MRATHRPATDRIRRALLSMQIIPPLVRNDLSSTRTWRFTQDGAKAENCMPGWCRSTSKRRSDSPGRSESPLKSRMISSTLFQGHGREGLGSSLDPDPRIRTGRAGYFSR